MELPNKQHRSNVCAVCTVGIFSRISCQCCHQTDNSTPPVCLGRMSAPGRTATAHCSLDRYNILCSNEQLQFSNSGKTLCVAISETRTVSITVSGTVVNSVCLNDEPDESSGYATADFSKIISNILPLIYDCILPSDFQTKSCR